MIVYLTSDDGQFGGHSDFTFCVFGDAFVNVFVARRSEWLDTQHCSRPFIKLYGLDQWESGMRRHPPITADHSYQISKEDSESCSRWNNNSFMTNLTFITFKHSCSEEWNTHRKWHQQPVWALNSCSTLRLSSAAELNSFMLPSDYFTRDWHWLQAKQDSFPPLTEATRFRSSIPRRNTAFLLLLNWLYCSAH